MRRRALYTLAALTFLSVPLYSQTLTVGPPFTGTPNGADSTFDPVRTTIDLFAPASATGIVTSVHLYWSAPNCPNALKMKFFRPSTNLTMVGERGPFNVTSRDLTITLSPPVPVKKGDVIGVTRLTTCGAPMFFHQQNATYAYFAGDFVGPYSVGYNYFFGSRLALAGTGMETEDILRGIVPVAGSAAGNGGSQFRTSLQLLNTSGGEQITGKLRFHPAGQSGTTADPAVIYTLTPGQVVSYSDVATMFGRSGIGSIDLLTTQTASIPFVVTRVYNDVGAAGTSGLTEELIEISGDRVINVGATAFLVAPPDPSRTRFNIGVRSLLAGATLTVVLRDSTGGVVKTLTKTYPPNWFSQVDSTSFLTGTALQGSESIAITVTAGSVVAYGSTTDNITNDPAIQFAVSSRDHP